MDILTSSIGGGYQTNGKTKPGTTKGEVGFLVQGFLAQSPKPGKTKGDVVFLVQVSLAPVPKPGQTKGNRLAQDVLVQIPLRLQMLGRPHLRSSSFS